MGSWPGRAALGARAGCWLAAAVGMLPAERLRMEKRVERCSSALRVRYGRWVTGNLLGEGCELRYLVQLGENTIKTKALCFV